MHPPIAALGGFIFAPSFGSFEEMEQSWETPRASLDVIGSRPVKQWMGPGDTHLNLSGSIWPEIQLPGLLKIDALAGFASSGIPLPFLMATGQFLGMWGIANTIKSSGELARFGFPGEIGFEIELERV